MKRLAPGVELADAIETEVRTGKHKPGAVLGFENDLIARYETGRAVVRQAVRILEQRGIAYSRRGKGGGLVVARPRSDSAVRALSIVIDSQMADFTDISGLISASDNHLFLNCASKIDADASRKVQESIGKFEALSADEFLRVDAHKQVLNSFFAAFGDAAASLAQQTANACGRDLIPFAMNISEFRQRGEIWELTRQLVDAQLAGNVSLMFDLRMRQWRLFAAKWVSVGNLDRVRDRVPPKIEERGRAQAEASESGAERLAREILRDARQLNWKIGERIGGTEELISRYGTSANLLRQAVCILEEYSAVKMLRGRTGGLLIAAPEEEVAIQRAVSYLRGASADPGDVRGLLVQIGLEALNRTPHATDRKRLPELRAAIDRMRGALAARDRRSGEQPYLAIVRLTNSPALHLFVRVLTAFLSGSEPGPARRGEVTYLDEMFDSLISGNTPNARRAFIQYANVS